MEKSDMPAHAGKAADCIFCKIVAGDIQTEKTFSDEVSVAFLDSHPKGPKHTLLIPKDHYQWFYQLPDALSDSLFRTAKRLAQGLKEETGADYIHLSIVGEDVPHVHIHLIPKQFSKTAGVLPMKEFGF